MPVTDQRPDPRRPGPPHARLVRGAGLVAVLVVALVMTLLGCRTPEERYRVLSFFFDGVPVPESLLKDMPELAGTVVVNTEEGAPKTPPKPPTYFHTPYVNRSCFGCHDRDKGFQTPAKGGEMCKNCHERHFDYQAGDWVHGPAMLGECRYCHEPHKAHNKGLLTDAQPALCFQCHDPALLHEDAMHGQFQDDVKCSVCHDPHVVGNRRLLADSRTYRNRGLAAFKPVSMHQPYKEKKCAECHVIEESNRVKEGIDAICRSCHTTLIEAAPPGTHQAVKDAACVACHNPHQSPLPHLLRPTAEEMCFKCHKPEEIQTPRHPPVVKADCLICHAGHESTQPHLLRTPEAIAQRALPVAEPPADAAAPEAPQPPSEAPATPAPNAHDHDASGEAS